MIVTDKCEDDMSMPNPLRLLPLVALVFPTLPGAAAEPITAREQVNAALWMQSAAEYQALTQQVYDQATRRLAQLHKGKGSAAVEQAGQRDAADKPPAVVLDIDETVLTNLPFNTALINHGTGFDAAAWQAWVMTAQAQALAGAQEFIRKARQLGYRVMFITNRNCNANGSYDAHGISTDCPQQAATIANLTKALGYAPHDADILMRFENRGRDDSDKQARRRELAQQYRIVMLLGDDLNDFIRRADYRRASHARHWGQRWFLLPNPLYGSWEQGYPDLPHKYAALHAADTTSPPNAADALTLVSWNLEWLADPHALERSDFWRKCVAPHLSNQKLRAELPVCDAYVRAGIRTAAEYNTRKLLPLQQALVTLASQPTDVLAVQEVQNPAALQAILPAGYRVACVTTREDAQNLGFIVRNDSRWQFTCEEVPTLSLEQDHQVPRAVRRGLALTLTQGGTSFRILNVHLKAGCPKGPMNKPKNDHCTSLQHQVAPLEQWIEQQANHNQAFMIIGDWNRDLQAEVQHQYPARSDNSDPSGAIHNPAKIRNLFPEINDGVPVNSVMQLGQVDRHAAMDSHCHAVLDQVVFSNLLLTQLEQATFQDTLPPAALRALATGASDHCALQTRLVFKAASTVP
jgi:5'-nucleotidase (lipoprotein e(P4) family)